MAKMWVVAALAAAAAGGAVGYALVRARMPDLGPAGPNHDLAPESLACYAEIGDATGLWKKMSGTESWGDFAASKLASVVTEAEPVKDFLAALDQIATKAGYRVDAANAMKLAGRELSVGVKLDPAGGTPQVLVLTKLDTAALAKDLLKGGTDLDALWEEMQRRTGKLDFKVTSSEHRNHKVATAERGGVSYHAALLGDTLAVATDAALVRAAIDCRVDGGAKSIGHRAAFQTDMKALPQGAAIVTWYDLDALDAGRASLDAGLARFADSAATTGAVHAILDGTKGAHSLGLAAVVPDGDLYRVSWAYSKSEDLFADRASPDIAGLLGSEWAFYGQVRQIGAVADAWARSSLRKNLAGGEVGKWFDRVLNDPAGALARAKTKFGHALPFAGAMDEMEEDLTPPGKDPAALLDSFGDRFTGKMAKHLAEQWLAAMTKGEFAIAVDVGKDPDASPRIAGSIRLDTEGRLFALAALGAAQGTEGALLKAETCGTRQVWTMAGKADATWAFVGDAFICANDPDLVRKAAQSDGAAAPKGHVAEAMAAMKPGWRAFASYDLDGAVDRFLSHRQDHGDLEQARKILEIYREAGFYGLRGDVAVYVPDDFASVEMRARIPFPPAATDDGRLLRTELSDAREPRCWASLPDTTILHTSAPASGVRAMWMLVKGFAALVGGSTESMESGFRESMGLDLEKELIPALGRELFVAVTYKPAPPGDANPDAPPAVLPGILLGIEVKDQAVVRKALDRAMELVDDNLRESQGSGAESPFTREGHEGVEIVRLTLPREGMPIAINPACAFHDGFLVFSLDDATLRACVDAHKGKAPRLADSPVFAGATGALGRKCSTFMLLDWDRLADQVAVYAPFLGQTVAADDVSYPDYPENGDQEEWRRRVEEYQKKMAAGRGAGEAKVRRWIDAFRLIEFAGTSDTWSGDVSESTFVLRFKK